MFTYNHCAIVIWKQHGYHQGNTEKRPVPAREAGSKTQIITRNYTLVIGN